jgi:XTP/dITP diphosphohydrolase
MTIHLSRVVVASKNPDKVREVEDVLAALDLGIEVVRGLDWPDVDETEDTLEGNALLKARAVRDHTGLAALADDTGLEVDALGGAPGVRAARFAGPDAGYEENVDKLLAMMEGETDRRARFRTVVAVVDPAGGELLVEGVLEGSIGRERRGSGGFGYDPVFLVGDRTLAEYGAAEKNRISHRALALAALASELAGGAGPAA